MQTRGLSDQLLRMALSVFVACLLLYLAVCLIRSIWPWLVGGGLTLVVLIGLAGLVRRRRERW